jgi:hypothetical protein
MQQPALADITVTEIETLATMMKSAFHHMGTAHKYVSGDVLGGYAWDRSILGPGVTEMCEGFYAIVNAATEAGATPDLYQSFL